MPARSPSDRFVGVLRGDATKLPFADGSFDRVITSEVLEHIQDDVAAIAELVRVLKPGGTFAATVPTWFPEKINWMLSDEYHAPKSVGGHVRIYTATELKAKLRSAGLEVTGSHHAHALHSPYWWLKCAVGPPQRQTSRGRRVPEAARVGDREAARVACSGRARALARARQELHRLRPQAGAIVSTIPHIDGVLTADEVVETRRVDRRAAARHGHDPVVPRRPLRPVEPRRDGDGARRRRPARTRPSAPTSGSSTCSAPTAAGATTTCPTARVEEAKLDTNVCAYVATGVWHHWLCTWDRGFVDHLWPTVERALDWVLGMRKPNGTHPLGPHRGRHPVGLRAAHRLVEHHARAAVRRSSLADAHQRAAAGLGRLRPTRIAARDPTSPTRSSRRTAGRWTGTTRCSRRAMIGEPAKARLADGWAVFAMEGKGIRCVSDEPWVTATETAECSHRPRRDRRHGHRHRPAALDPFAPARRRLVLDRHRVPDARALPGRRDLGVHAAAVILAADAITGASPASAVFVPRAAD